MPLHENRYLDTRPETSGDLPAGVPVELLKRAALLPEPDRSMVYMSFKAGATRHMIARAVGRSPGTITRRLQRIGARLHDPLVVALIDPCCPLVPEFRQIGIEHFLQGLSTHAIGEKHRMSHDRVRRMLNAIRLWHDAGVRPVDPWKRELSPRRSRRSRRRQEVGTIKKSADAAKNLHASRAPHASQASHASRQSHISKGSHDSREPHASHAAPRLSKAPQKTPAPPQPISSPCSPCSPW